jgi:hypothetical protein
MSRLISNGDRVSVPPQVRQLGSTEPGRSDSFGRPSPYARAPGTVRGSSARASCRRPTCRGLFAALLLPCPESGAASHGSMVMWQASRRGINTRIDQHLDLVTTILATPEMNACPRTPTTLAQSPTHYIQCTPFRRASNQRSQRPP